MNHHDTPVLRSPRKSLGRTLPKLFLTSAVFWIPIALFVLLANQVRETNPLPGDVAILQAIHAHASPFLDTLAVIVTDLGSAAAVVAAVAIAAGVLWYKRRRGPALFLLFSAGGTAAINAVFKVLFHRARPDLWPRIVTETDYSFPSGHAMISSALAFSVILLLWNTRYRWWAVTVGTLYFVLVGLSRLYLGVHFPSDVYGGWCVSLLWVATLYYAFQQYVSRAGKTKAAATSQ